MAEAGSIATTVVTDVAAQVVAIAALCGALGLLSRLKPVRWIWGRLVSGPLGEWLGRAIGRGVATFHAEKIEPALTEMREDMTVMRQDITTPYIGNGGNPSKQEPGAYSGKTSGNNSSMSFNASVTGAPSISGSVDDAAGADASQAHNNMQPSVLTRWVIKT